MRCDFDAVLMRFIDQSRSWARPTAANRPDKAIGAWRIAAGSVLTLEPRQAGRLHVRAGCAWLTRSGDATDHVLCAGNSLSAQAGQSLVAEGLGGDVWVDWQAG